MIRLPLRYGYVQNWQLFCRWIFPDEYPVSYYSELREKARRKTVYEERFLERLFCITHFPPPMSDPAPAYQVPSLRLLFYP